ncbi:hypothetical protein N7471_005526 [Penicillium samsonianum]|uniref:uncharacterized protein n=1 Tax=Penicillium samsonianum TaxID=1882272 RepID=UPI002546635B|nr:uncharacterized protein N7471_005526 [Penicillium samsonianum]KAJ6139040.1 hypothetical protein N7471_005526 [Penicillium samsonianum]
MQHDFLLLNPVSLSALVILLIPCLMMSGFSHYSCFNIFILHIQLVWVELRTTWASWPDWQIGRLLRSERWIGGLMLDSSMPEWIIQA